MLATAGITVSRGSMGQWANRAIALLKPVHEAQWRSVLESAVIQTAGTLIRAGRHPGKPGSMKKGCFWPVLGDRGEVVLPFSGDRRHRKVADFLGDCIGTLVSHGYGACEAYVAARGATVTHQNCWINTRRNFREPKDSHPTTAGEALATVAAIYGIEEEIRDRPTPERLRAQRTRSRAAVDAFWDWHQRTLEDPALTPKHPIWKAIGYAVERRVTPEPRLRRNRRASRQTRTATANTSSAMENPPANIVVPEQPHARGRGRASGRREGVRRGTASRTGAGRIKADAERRALVVYETHAAERDLAAALGMKVSIDHVADGEAGSVTVRYGSLKQFDEFCQRLLSATWSRTSHRLHRALPFLSESAHPKTPALEARIKDGYGYAGIHGIQILRKRSGIRQRPVRHHRS